MDLNSLLPQFGGFIWTVLAFVIALSIIVAVHEYGHYIIGRLSGIRAQVFSLGFGPVLCSRIDRHGTRWQIAALPFGGYVKFLGDADAASGKDGAAIEALPAEQRRHTMHGAPLWARVATIIAGPLFNFILAAVIFTGFLFWQGIAISDPIIARVSTGAIAAEELHPGDRILAIGGHETPDLATVLSVADSLTPVARVSYSVERDGQKLEVQGPYPLPPMVTEVMGQSAAWDAGLKRGDVIMTVDGKPIAAFSQIRDLVGQSEGRELALTVLRKGETIAMTLAPRRVDLPAPGGGFETRWLIGLTGGLVFEPQTRTPGLFEALSLGTGQVWSVASTSLSGLAHMISGAISSCNLRGPLGIAENSGAAASAGLANFIWFIAVLSTAVGLMNLFPIPVLDGGHLIFHAWEAVTGKPPSDTALRLLMSIGLALLAALMLFALRNDLFCP